jgi:aspartate-semialdehyde dehydrogenase
LSETIALIGSESLMGREVRDLMADKAPGLDLRLIADTEASTDTIGEHAGEPALIAKLTKVALVDADAVMLAGSPESSRMVLDLAPGTPVIDLTHAQEENPRSRLRAPMVEPHDLRVPHDAIQSIAHPAAIALALLLRRLDTQYKLRAWIAHIFEPASERGTPGVEELEQQTVSLLSFKPLPKKVFDNQASFTLLARLGEEAVVKIEDIEARIERHLATLLHNSRLGPMPSLRLVQAPVFHGYAFSIWLEFDGEAPDAGALESMLATDDISVHDSSVEPPSNTGIAGQDGVSVGAIVRDRNNPRAVWLWMAADNLRLAAQNALLVAREIL